MFALLRHYWLALALTLAIFALAFGLGGTSVLFTVVVLTLLEITFSVDNAVINSKVLVTMSPLWQKVFLTVGIFLAVFVVRFAIPLVLVVFTAGLSIPQTLDLAINNPHEYEAHLHEASPAISAFGGTFLLMIALSYFIDAKKRTHWIVSLERALGHLGRFHNITSLIMLCVAITLYFTASDHQMAILVAAVCAMALHLGLNLIDAIFEKQQEESQNIKQKVGWAAFSAFIYLEVLDASFSLDGVIGAFALTSDIFVIIAGLGAGAVWVRSITVHLVRAQTLTKYRFLENGAHWAIAFLGTVMYLRLYHVELPEWSIGTLSLATIAAAIWWSTRKRHREAIKES
jgi:uncharacterized protein